MRPPLHFAAKAGPMILFKPLRSTRMSGSDTFRFFALIATSLAIAVVVLAGVAVLLSALYLVKSWLGVDLMAGPSPLHGLLYHLVR